MTSDYSRELKIILIGNCYVGKTFILRRFVEDKLERDYLSTVGVDFRSKEINVYNTIVKLKIWDTAGQDKYRTITKQIFRGADGVILVFDVSNKESFEKIPNWMKQVKSNLSLDEIGVIILGNKCDIEQREVSNEEGIELVIVMKSNIMKLLH